MYLDDPLCDLIGEAMSEPPEQMLEFALVGFRTMEPDLQKSFLIAALDEYCGLAKEGKVDEQTARQILFRAQLVSSFLAIGKEQPGNVRHIQNA